jgi:hypothetical protein
MSPGRVAVSQVPWNVPPPSVRIKNVFLPNGRWLFFSLMDEHRGPGGEAAPYGTGWVPIAAASSSATAMRTAVTHGARGAIIPHRQAPNMSA